MARKESLRDLQAEETIHTKCVSVVSWEVRRAFGFSSGHIWPDFICGKRGVGCAEADEQHVLKICASSLVHCSFKGKGRGRLFDCSAKRLS